MRSMAGHAVVAWAYGLDVAWLKLLPDDPMRAGEVRHETPDHLTPESQVALAMAGWCGANMSGVPQSRRGEFDRDLAQIWKVLFRVHPDDDGAQDELENRGIAEAQTILNQYAVVVRSVAVELDSCGGLDGAEFKRLVGSVRTDSSGPGS
jgi:hypothetical protein